MRSRVSPAMVVALLALVVAMGGSAGAAKALLTGKDIKDGSITSADIAKGAIKSKHLARKSVRSANVADGAIKARQIDSAYSSPIICPGGVVVVQLPCPAQPWADAQASGVPVDEYLNDFGGTHCYSKEIPFQTGSLGGANQWTRTDDDPADLPYAGYYGQAAATVGVTFSHIPDAYEFGVQLVKFSTTGQLQPLPGSRVMVTPSGGDTTAANLSYQFPAGQILAGEYVRVRVIGCVNAERDVDTPTVQFIRAVLLPMGGP
jgi:hypothetical protein